MSAAQPARRDWSGIRGVIVDLDGTMVDTAGDFHAAVNAMLGALARLHPHLPAPAPLTREAIVSFVGKGSENLIRRVLDARFTPAHANGLFADALALYDREYLRINGRFSQVYAGVAEGWRASRPPGCAGLRDQQALQLHRAAAGQDRAGPVFRAGLRWRRLPAAQAGPAALLKVAEAFRLEPAQMAAIGDSENDAQAARAAGMGVLLVPYGYNHGNPVQGVDADGIVGTIAQAASLLTA